MTRSRVNDGLPRERGVRKTLQEGKRNICWFRVIEETLLNCGIRGCLIHIRQEHVRYVV